MNSTSVFKTYTYSLATLSGCCLIFAISRLPNLSLQFSNIIIMVAAILVTSRLTLSFPWSKSHLSFSDSIVFLAFLLYGGELAIMLATLETIVNCFYLKLFKKLPLTNVAILFNISNTLFSTTIVYFVWLLIPHATSPSGLSEVSNLIFVLSILAFSHFLLQSVLGSFYYSLKNNARLFETWKTIAFTSSMTQIAGAILAGVVYKLVYSSDIVTLALAFLVFVVVYLNYKQMIRNINESIELAETAERSKAELAREQAEEAEQHASQLESLLKTEEQNSKELRQSKKDLQYSVFHDNLTDLPNRAYLLERLSLLLELGDVISKNYYALFLDLSRFKNINDSLGHTIGDEVLKIVALRLRRALRDEDTIARLGGDEFAIILNDLKSMNEANEVSRKIYNQLTQPIMIQGHKIFADLHIGIAPLDSEQNKPEDVLRDADIAMHSAKDKNKSIAVFDKEVRLEYLEYLRLEDDLRYAIERNELSMNYQPLISLKDGSLLGFEALLRWNHYDLGLISPAKFIPISEDSGLIIPITNWILQETCTQIASWQKISHDNRNILVSVNISGKHLTDDSLILDVKNALNVSGLSPESLKLEITESTAMSDADQTIKILHQLKSLGVKISIDDFGTGYSSLSYLHQLPFDSLKIDRSFVNNAMKLDEDSGILQTIVSLTKNLNKEVIAEGIETIEQMKLLKYLDCDYGQGYLFSRPLAKSDMEAELYKGTNWIPDEADSLTDNIPKGIISKEDNLPVF